MKWRRQLLIVGAIALVVRVAIYVGYVAGHLSRALSSDSVGYLTLAHHLGPAYLRADAAYKPLTVLRTPVYPVFAGGVFQLWDSLQVLIVLQLLAGVATACLTAVLGKKLVGARVGFAAGLVVAVDANSAVYATQILTETLFALILLMGVFSLWRSLRGDWRWAMVAGMVFAAAALTRPVAMYMVPVACLIGLTATRRRGVVVLVLAASFLIPTGAWVTRNKIVADYAGASSIQEVNLLLYRAAGAISHDTGERFAAVKARLKREAAREAGPSPTVGAEAGTYRRLALRYIEQHPVGTAYITAHGAVAILFGPGTKSLEQLLTGKSHPPASPVLNVFLLGELFLILGGASIGLVILIRQRRWQDLAILALLPAYFVVISAGPEAYSRFRVPIVPFLAILFGIAVSTMVRQLELRRTPGAALGEPLADAS